VRLTPSPAGAANERAPARQRGCGRCVVVCRSTAGPIYQGTRIPAWAWALGPARSCVRFFQGDQRGSSVQGLLAMWSVVACAGLNQTVVQGLLLNDVCPVSVGITRYQRWRGMCPRVPSKKICDSRERELLPNQTGNERPKVPVWQNQECEYYKTE